MRISIILKNQSLTAKIQKPFPADLTECTDAVKMCSSLFHSHKDLTEVRWRSLGIIALCHILFAVDFGIDV
jgi:hypothetical protein